MKRYELSAWQRGFVGGRHSREFSGMIRSLAKMRRRRRSLVTFPLGILLTFGKENKFPLLSLNRKILLPPKEMEQKRFL